MFTKISSSRFDEDVVDLLRPRPDGINSYTSDASTEYSFIFTLDDIVGITGSNESSYWLSGSRTTGRSLTASGSSAATRFYRPVINLFLIEVIIVLQYLYFGGFDGLDITERDPFRNSFLSNGRRL